MCPEVFLLDVQSCITAIQWYFPSLHEKQFSKEARVLCSVGCHHDVLCGCNEDTFRLILEHSIYYKILEHMYIQPCSLIPRRHVLKMLQDAGTDIYMCCKKLDLSTSLLQQEQFLNLNAITQQPTWPRPSKWQKWALQVIIYIWNYI